MQSLSHKNGSITSLFIGKDDLSWCCWAIGGSFLAANWNNCYGGIYALRGISGVGGIFDGVSVVVKEVGRSWSGGGGTYNIGSLMVGQRG